MKNYFCRLNLLLLVIVLPTIYGCGGGGIAGLASFLFGSGGGFLAGGGGGGGIAGAGGGGLIGGLGGGATPPTIVNPEPTTMILMGSGMAAMAYYRSKMQK